MFVERENFYEIEEFEKYGVKAIYTKKIAGNMSDFCTVEGEEKGIQSENRKKIMVEIGVQNKCEVFSHQIHSNNIKIIENDTDKYIYEKEENIDGFLTKRRDVVLCTFYADCLPIFVYDIKNNVIGVAHSGWIGTYNEIMKNLIFTMERKFNSEKKNLLMGLGVGISMENYEVGKEFYEKFSQKFTTNEYGNIVEKSFYFNEKTGKYYFNNTEFNKLMGLKLGILKENIIISDEDTYKEKFHSHRREGKKSGRAMGLITFLKET